MSTKIAGRDGIGGSVWDLSSLYSISGVFDDVGAVFEYKDALRSLLMFSE